MKNKTAVVTGASGGIGEAVCRILAKEGYDIILHYNKSEEKAHKIAESIKAENGVQVLCVGCDLSFCGAGKQLGEKIKKLTDRVDLLVNNAGLSLVGVFQSIPSESVARLMNVNLNNAMELTSELLPLMIREQRGNIINVSSVWGITGGSCEVHYSASKAGLIGMTKALAKEVGLSGITVNCVSPGVILTDMTSHFDEDTMNELKNETPLNKIGTPEDVAGAVAFLASSDADFITGQDLAVNGGMNI